ncbi:MAG: nuclear transport factor 2 family protein [Pyrinomonadaceae bacterium]|nr:nuclear transport factor 2 family protein [Pyrinomonadaceae bacterium]MDQ3173939.1 nuclear transport factor 2 family protein [Acidobacteriota bacterium]
MKRILATTLLILSATSVAFGQCSEADKQKLMAFDKAWGEGGRRGDKAFLQNVYADEYTNMAPAGTLTKTQAIENAVRDADRRKANQQNADSVSHDSYVITCTPNTATITHRNVITAKVDGKEQNLYTRSVHFLEKRGGEWKVVSDAGGPLGDAGQLLYMEMDWSDADKKGDVAWFERNFADDFYGVSSLTGKLNTKAEEVAEIKNRKEVIDSAVSSDMEARVEGNTGIVTGVYRLTGRDDKGQPMDRRIRYTDVYVKRDGRWLVVASQGTLIK